MHQVAFAKRKRNLLRDAMKLSVLCDCNVALIIFRSDGTLVQYSSTDAMDKILEQYAEACQHPHERLTNQDVSALLLAMVCHGPGWDRI